MQQPLRFVCGDVSETLSAPSGASQRRRGGKARQGCRTVEADELVAEKGPVLDHTPDDVDGAILDDEPLFRDVRPASTGSAARL